MHNLLELQLAYCVKQNQKSKRERERRREADIIIPPHTPYARARAQHARAHTRGRTRARKTLHLTATNRERIAIRALAIDALFCAGPKLSCAQSASFGFAPPVTCVCTNRLMASWAILICSSVMLHYPFIVS